MLVQKKLYNLFINNIIFVDHMKFEHFVKGTSL